VLAHLPEAYAALEEEARAAPQLWTHVFVRVRRELGDVMPPKGRGDEAVTMAKDSCLLLSYDIVRDLVTRGDVELR
jgi:hypothetical protein